MEAEAGLIAEPAILALGYETTRPPNGGRIPFMAVSLFAIACGLRLAATPSR